MSVTRHAEAMMYDDVLAQYLDYLTCSAAPTTVRLYRGVLTRAHRALPHGVIVAAEPELRAWLWSHPHPKTRETYYCALAGLHGWMHAQGISDYNPAADLPHIKVPERLPRPVTDAQARRILTESRQPVRLWSTIAAYAGARCVEICRLVRADITEQAVRLMGKGDRERVVPTHPALWAAVRGLPPGPVVAGSAAHPHRLSERCSREYRRLGLADVTAHRLRHWYATVMLEAVGDVRVVQELLGHRQLSTTAIYTRVSTARMRAAVAGLPDLTPAAA